MFKVGTKYKAAVKVDDSNTALAMGSGDLEVFATPALVALMERAAAMLAAEALAAQEVNVQEYAAQKSVVQKLAAQELAGPEAAAEPTISDRSLLRIISDRPLPRNTTVGAAIDIAHTKPTGIGDTVEATAELTAIEGRKLTFRVEARDSVGTIGEGTHVRYVVDRERFTSKL